MRYLQAPLCGVTANDTFIHLCQPGGNKSCAACCGIYNYVDSTREGLSGRLHRRTVRFRTEVRGTDDLLPFSRSIRAEEDETRRFDVIHCCEYAGFLDSEERHVGCLLHPARNGGIDRRDVSLYGRERSRFDVIFLSLSSFFRNRHELFQAEEMISKNIETLAAACDTPF